MPSTIGKCKLLSIKYTTLLEGETFLRNKHEIEFFEIKCTFFGRKENTITYYFDGKFYDFANIEEFFPFSTSIFNKITNNYQKVFVC